MERLYLTVSALYSKHKGVAQGHLQVYVSLKRGEEGKGNRRGAAHGYFPRMFIPFHQQGKRYILGSPLEAKDVTTYFSRGREWKVSEIKPPQHETHRFNTIIQCLEGSLEEILGASTSPLSRVKEAVRHSIFAKFPPYFRECKEGEVYGMKDRGKIIQVDLE